MNLQKVLDDHKKWLLSDGGQRADLWNANLKGANFHGADLEGADLEGANLDGAYLWNANLKGAKLQRCIGNKKEIKSMQIETWSVVYTSEIMSIGCEQHKICEWWKFTDEQISAMDNNALVWWKKWKPILQQIIEMSPAVAGIKEDK